MYWYRVTGRFQLVTLFLIAGNFARVYYRTEIAALLFTGPFWTFFWNKHEFIKVEELASCIGYADVVYIPKKGSSMPVILIELKWDKTEDGAINQIKKNQYPQVFKDYGGNNEVRKN